eukprot:Rmarinus@m.251
MSGDWLSLSETVVRNLKLLQFDSPPAVQRYGIQVDQSTFRSPNRRASEAVFHFLLLIIFEKQAEHEFKLLWPVRETTQSRDFLKVVLKFLTMLHNQGAMPLSLIRSSIVSSFGGERFQELICRLSTHAMRVLTSRYDRECEVPADLLSYASENPDELQTAITQRRNLCEHDAERFRSHVSLVASAQERWDQTASWMQAELNRLRQVEAEVIAHKGALDAKEANGRHRGSLEAYDDDLEVMRQIWREIMDRHDKTEQNRKDLYAVIGNNVNTWKIDGRRLSTLALGVASGGSSSWAPSSSPNRREASRSPPGRGATNDGTPPSALSPVRRQRDNESGGETVDLSALVRRFHHELRGFLHAALATTAAANEGIGVGRSDPSTAYGEPNNTLLHAGEVGVGARRRGEAASSMMKAAAVVDREAEMLLPEVEKRLHDLRARVDAIDTALRSTIRNLPETAPERILFGFARDPRDCHQISSRHDTLQSPVRGKTTASVGGRVPATSGIDHTPPHRSLGRDNLIAASPMGDSSSVFPPTPASGRKTDIRHHNQMAGFASSARTTSPFRPSSAWDNLPETPQNDHLRKLASEVWRGVTEADANSDPEETVRVLDFGVSSKTASSGLRSPHRKPPNKAVPHAWGDNAASFNEPLSAHDTFSYAQSHNSQTPVQIHSGRQTSQPSTTSRTRGAMQAANRPSGVNTADTGNFVWEHARTAGGRGRG